MDRSRPHAVGPAEVAGKIPDVSISAFTTSDMVQFGSSFEDLAPQVDKLSNVKEMFDTYPNAKKMSTDLEGHIYTLPNAGPEGFRGSSSHLMVNKTWLDKLGLKTPTTWDEFEAMLKAFKTEDPNGNGKADEVPFTFPALGTSNFSDNNPFVLLSSSGIVTQTRNQASQYGLYVDNGKVKPWLTSDNFKRLATWLNKLVSEGLLPAQALTQDYSKFTASMQGDVPTAGAVFGWNQIALFGSKYACRSRRSRRPPMGLIRCGITLPTICSSAQASCPSRLTRPTRRPSTSSSTRCTAMRCPSSSTGAPFPSSPPRRATLSTRSRSRCTRRLPRSRCSRATSPAGFAPTSR